ncbi:serine hydrolase FSH [Gautieria morchelliformis]|nr:serine hydrolase FSH [Gautieria morchelliformis]
MRKVLMLHGFSQNASIFRKRMSVIRKACEGHVEFVFVDAPHDLVPVDLPGHALEWLQAAEANATTKDDSLTPRAWWRANDEKTVCNGLQESLLLLREILRETTFQGVLGFSQGAAMAAVLAAVLEKPELYEPFMIGGKAVHPKLDFFIPISGFMPSDPLLEHILSRTSTKLTTPSLHVVGDTDVIVAPERSQLLISVCDQEVARVERHEGGHFVPSKANWRRFLQEYLVRGPDAQIGSPSGFAPVTPAF